MHTAKYKKEPHRTGKEWKITHIHETKARHNGIENKKTVLYDSKHSSFSSFVNYSERKM